MEDNHKIMKIALYISILLCGICFGGNYREDTEKFKKANSPDSWIPVLDGRIRKDPGNAANYIIKHIILTGRVFGIRSGFDFREAEKIQKAGGEVKIEKRSGEIWAVEEKTGKVLGKMFNGTGVDPEAVDLTAEWGEITSAKFPHRLDIYYMQAEFYAAVDDFDSQLKTYRRMCGAFERFGSKMKWEYDLDLAKSGAHPQNELHHYFSKEFHKETPEGDRRANALAGLEVEFYPKSVISWNDLGLIRWISSDWKAAHEAWNEAVKLAPEDEISLENLAKSSMKLGLFKKSGECYSKLVEMTKDEKLRERAKKGVEAAKANQSQ